MRYRDCLDFAGWSMDGMASRPVEEVPLEEHAH